MSEESTFSVQDGTFGFSKVHHQASRLGSKPADGVGGQPQVAAELRDQALSLLEFGFALVPLQHGGKRPLAQAWNAPENLVTDRAGVELAWSAPRNIGVHLGASSLFSIDLDDESLAPALIERLGMSRQLLENHPHRLRGRGVKLWFRLDGLTPDQRSSLDGVRALRMGGRTILELRCGDGAQDVGPGSLHPQGFAYRWEGDAPQCREDLPLLPSAVLEAYMRLPGLQLELSSGPRIQPLPIAVPGSPPPRGGGLIDRYCQVVPVEQVLSRNGYSRRGDRWLSPNSTTGVAGISLREDPAGRSRAYSHHAADGWSGRAEDAFGLMCELEHGGDLGRALRAAALELGEDRPLPAASPEQIEQARRAWDAARFEVLDQVQRLVAQQGHLHVNARRSLVELAGQLVDLAVLGLAELPPLLRERFPAGWLRVGRLSMGLLYSYLSGHPSDLRVRLPLLAKLMGIRIVELVEGQPSHGSAILFPADPADLAFPGWPSDEDGQPLGLPSKAARRASRPRPAPSLEAGAQEGPSPLSPKNGKERGEGRPSLAAALALTRLLSSSGQPAVLDSGPALLAALAGSLACSARAAASQLAHLLRAGFQPSPAAIPGFQQAQRLERASAVVRSLGERLHRRIEWAEQALRWRPALIQPSERRRILGVRSAALAQLERLQDGETPWAFL